METKDHLILAGRWLRGSGGQIQGFSKLAFVLGNIMPDMNLLSYVKRENGRIVFKGHHYPCLMPEVCRILKVLGGTRFGIREYYSLGVLMHYTADAFTCAHNKGFQGSLREHVKYEARLHRCFVEGSPGIFKEKRICGGREKILEEMAFLHTVYEMEEAPGPDKDYEYICRAFALVGNLAPGRTFQYGKNRKLLHSQG